MTAWQTPEANANREHFLHWDHCCRSCFMQRQRIPFIYLSACYYCTQSVPFSQAEHKAEPIDNSEKKPQKAGTTNKTEHKKHQELHKVRDLVHFLLFVSFWFWGASGATRSGALWKNEFRKPPTSDNVFLGASKWFQTRGIQIVKYHF